MAGKKVISSYQENNLGETLHNLVLEYRPRKIIEFGVLYGYSTIHMAQALAKIGRGHLYGYDLWECYSFNHTTIDVARSNVKDAGLDWFVTLYKMDFQEWLRFPSSFDMLHLDISNDGDLIEDALTRLMPQIEDGAIVVFEGGSVERDQYKWMKQFNKRPIHPLKEKFGFEIIDERFPSISMMRKS